MTNAPARRLPAIMTVRFDASAPCCDDRFSPSPNNFEPNKNGVGVDWRRSRRGGFLS
jgi:hypothetical protein